MLENNYSRSALPTPGKQKLSGPAKNLRLRGGV